MKKKIATFIVMVMCGLLAFEGQASVSVDKTDSGEPENGVQDFRLPGAPSGGYRGDFRLRVRGKSKGVKHKTNRRSHRKQRGR